jgi:hypothetical protein
MKKIVLVSFLVFMLALGAGFWLRLIKTPIRNTQNDQGSQSEVNLQDQAFLQQQEAGQIGEVVVRDENTGEEKQLVNSDLPIVSTSTTGKIERMEGRVLVLRGSGNNFADAEPREIRGTLTDQTKVFDLNKKTFVGEAGLSVLKTGMQVLLEGEGNIRGKTEFTILTLNILY